MCAILCEGDFCSDLWTECFVGGWRDSAALCREDCRPHVTAPGRLSGSEQVEEQQIVVANIFEGEIGMSFNNCLIN